jgi:hypothetical protein
MVNLVSHTFLYPYLYYFYLLQRHFCEHFQLFLMDLVSETTIADIKKTKKK